MIERLFQDLAALPQVEAIALGGSRAGESYDAASDYDVYVYVTAPVPEEVRRTLLAPLCSVTEIGNRFWEEEDNCVFLDGVGLDLLWRDLDGFLAGIAQVADRCQPSNSYTTCMWHNLVTCKVVYDRDGRLEAARERYRRPYPEALKRAVIARGRRLLHGSLPAYDAQIAKAVKRGDLVSVNHRTAEFLAAYFDVLFALNGQTHPGEKRLMALARQRCPLLPARFEENLNALFAHLFTDGEAALADIARINAELEKILPPEEA